MSTDTQSPRTRMMIFILLVCAILGTALLSAFSVESVQAGNGTADEILVFNRGTKTNPFSITKSLNGFVMEVPSGAANANWVSGQYAGFADGTLYYRARIVSIPKSQNRMKFGFCVWQSKFTREECRGQWLTGAPGAEATWSHKLSDMWVKKPIDWAQPRQRHGFIVRNAKNKPVSSKKGWNWGGENPDNWYPMKVHYTVVLVKKGGTFDGWHNYGW